MVSLKCFWVNWYCCPGFLSTLCSASLMRSEGWPRFIVQPLFDLGLDLQRCTLCFLTQPHDIVISVSDPYSLNLDPGIFLFPDQVCCWIRILSGSWSRSRHTRYYEKNCIKFIACRSDSSNMKFLNFFVRVCLDLDPLTQLNLDLIRIRTRYTDCFNCKLTPWGSAWNLYAPSPRLSLPVHIWYTSKSFTPVGTVLLRYRYKVPNNKVPNHKIPNKKVPNNKVPK